jgi:hypothetical protein
VNLARQQGAWLWEIRASISLTRLWKEPEKGEDGLALLTTVYRQCREGFQAADLDDRPVLLLTGAVRLTSANAR